MMIIFLLFYEAKLLIEQLKRDVAVWFKSKLNLKKMLVLLLFLFDI